MRKLYYWLVCYLLLTSIPAHSFYTQYYQLCAQYLVAGQQVYAAQSRWWFDQFRQVKLITPRPWQGRALTDLEFLQGEKEQSTTGIMRSVEDPIFATRIYFTGTGTPQDLEGIPVVKEDARALVIFLPGAGTEGASGADFNYKANRLARLGIATLSFDYPFHQEASQNNFLQYAQYFVFWLQALIHTYRHPRIPILVIGHSFGANLVAELLKYDPFLSNNAIMLSPGAYNATLEQWMNSFTARRVLARPEFRLNRSGASWVYNVSSQLLWQNPQGNWFPDPTLVNPSLRLRLVYGENDEFIPGPLDKDWLPTDGPRTYDIRWDFRAKFNRVSCLVEPQAGHLLMGHKDKDGLDVAIREILWALGIDPLKENELRAQGGADFNSPLTFLGQQYFFNRFFHYWTETTPSIKQRLSVALKIGDENEARLLEREYRQALDARRAQIIQNIRATETTAPTFYNVNKGDIDRLGSKHVPLTRLFSRYLEFLETP
jgi:pimeloyl-ACP methyl ester carboxylesterase